MEVLNKPPNFFSKKLFKNVVTTQKESFPQEIYARNRPKRPKSASYTPVQIEAPRYRITTPATTICCSAEKKGAATKERTGFVVKGDMQDMKYSDLLKKVRRVEAPPFLLTRIEAKLDAARAARTPVSWQWAGAIAFGLLLLLHLGALQSDSAPSGAAAHQIAQSLSLQTSHQLYDE